MMLIVCMFYGRTRMGVTPAKITCKPTDSFSNTPTPPLAKTPRYNHYLSLELLVENLLIL